MVKTIRERYLEQFTANFLKAIELTTAKGKDYAGGEDTYSNFRASAEAASLPGQPVSLEQTLLVRLADKDSRIKNLLARPNFEGAVADEKIEDTLLDRIVYSNILLTWLQLGRPEPDTIFEDNTPAIEPTRPSEVGAVSPDGKLEKFFNWAGRKLNPVTK